ncbi:hypothetical protein COOONC_10334, partial [Cooperia oncophora]
ISCLLQRHGLRTISSYFLFRQDRKERRGGGVCCLVRGNLCVHRVEQVNPIKADVLCLEIFSPPKATHFRFTVVYRPPNSTRREDDGLVDVLREMVSAQVNSIIVGDLNLQVDWKNLRADNASSAAFLDFFQESGLEQHVLQPTHGSNTLDLVLSTSHSIQNVSLLPPLANSDHASVRFELLEGFSDAALLPTPDFLKVNYDRLNEYLSNVDWLGLFNNYVSMDDIYRRFCKTVYKALTLFVPLKFPQRRPIKYPLHIRNLLAQKERLFRILDNPMSCPLYRKVCRDVDYHLKKFVSNLERHLGNQASLKRLHQYVRHTEGPMLKHLGKYFASVFSAPVSSTGVLEYGAASSQSGDFDIYFHPRDVYAVLKKLKPSLSEPFD